MDSKHIFLFCIQTLSKCILILYRKVKGYFESIGPKFNNAKMEMEDLKNRLENDDLRSKFLRLAYDMYPHGVLVSLVFVVPLLVVLAFYVAIKWIVLPFIRWILGLAFILYMFNPKRSTVNFKKTDPEFYRCNVRYALFQCLCELGTLIPIKALNVDSEIKAWVEDQGHSIWVRSLVLKSKNVSLSPDDCNRIKAQIQETLRNHLMNLRVPLCTTPTFDPRREIPTLFVESVSDAGINLAINIIIADTSQAIDFIRFQQNKLSAPDKSVGNDRDF